MTEVEALKLLQLFRLLRWMHRPAFVCAATLLCTVLVKGVQQFAQVSCASPPVVTARSKQG